MSVEDAASALKLLEERYGEGVVREALVRGLEDVNAKKIAEDLMNHAKIMITKGKSEGKIHNERDYLDGYLHGITTYLLDASTKKEYRTLPLIEKNIDTLLGWFEKMKREYLEELLK